GSRLRKDWPSRRAVRRHSLHHHRHQLGLLGRYGISQTMNVETINTDILILGAGGAGLMAAMHAHIRAPQLDITVVVKGMLGQSGCTRMVQGGYNAVLNPADSFERHFTDTIRGGA